MIATYRLQVHPAFDFADVEALVPYLKKLGVSHLYLSPITEARPGSTHGYDVIDHNAVSEVLGGRESLDRLLDAARAGGLKLILDFVPNHTGVGPNSAAWQDVLAYGPHAAYADYFDIDWIPLKRELRGKILLPFLGRPYGEALDAGEITLAYAEGGFYAAYADHHFALAPHTYTAVLEAVLERHERNPYRDLKDLVEAYRSLQPQERTKAEALRPRLETLATHLDLATPAEAVTGEALHQLLERQYWRPAYWKTAGYEVNYRRFFSINDLVALRMEDPQVFRDAHRLLSELLTEEAVAGVRVDHIDGLYDPHQYLDRLHELGAEQAWVEKILASGETLPEAWPVEGSTGYVFLNDAMHALLRTEGLAALDRTYRRLVPEAVPYDEEAYRSKRLVIETALTSELLRLAYGLNRLSEADYHTRDFTFGALRDALIEVVTAFDRYRTYLPHDPDEAREVLQHALYEARRRTPAVEPSVYDFIAHVLHGELHEDLHQKQRAWTARFQQYTAPVAAKGAEDTAFYRYLRLTALNEVGGNPAPAADADPVHAFHARARFHVRRYPCQLLATATHDHKRGEDTRMRLITLAEVPDAWEETARALDDVGRDYQGMHGPSRFDAYLFYQTLVALWHGADLETLPDRLWTYVQKASRESMRRTSWINPDEAYERDLEAFVRGVLADGRTPETITPLAEVLARRGFQKSLSQLVLKCTAPGVPDFYQGCELLDLSLVDPDNRHPVDYKRRQALLDDLQPLLGTPDADVLWEMIEAQDERAKLIFTARLLYLRQKHEALFMEGNYQALELEENGADDWIAFVRVYEGTALVVAVPRFPNADVEHPTTIPLPDDLTDRTWTNALSGQTLEIGDVLDTEALPLPWAVFTSMEGWQGSACTPPSGS